MKRCYNATYRLRKKGFNIITKAKTIFAPPTELSPEMKILLQEYHFIIQTELF